MIQTSKPIPIHHGVGGEFRLVLRDLNGRVVRDSGWFNNTVLDQGLDLLAQKYHTDVFGAYQGTVQSWALLGSGATPPTTSDTGMDAYLGSAITSNSDTYTSPSNGGSPNYEIYRTFQYRFNAGNATGTIAEVGVGCNSANNDGTLFARQLVSPTFTKSIDQVLDVFYRITWYNDLTDKTGTVTIDSVVYDYVMRSYRSEFLFNNRVGGPIQIGTGLSGYYGGGDGDLVAIAGVSMTNNAPNGTWAGDNVLIANRPYIHGSHYQDFTYIADIDRFSWPEGTGNLRGTYMAGFLWQHQMSFLSQVDGVTGIPKDDTNELSLTFRFSWSRR